MGETAEARDWAIQYLKSCRNVKAITDTIANITDRDRLVVGNGRCNGHRSRKCVGASTHPMSKLLCRNTLPKTARHLFPHLPWVVRHVRFATHVDASVCFEHAADHSLRIQRPLPWQDWTLSDSQLMP